jgi:Zinc dependent phospholipase C.
MKLLIALAMALLIAVTSLMAWGSKPHADIIDAALAALPRDSGLVERLGENAPRLRAFVQMGDWNDCLVARGEQWRVTGAGYPSPGQMFYANDYLVFPASPKLFQHMVPDVKTTYGPFFDRALQALRMESASNAARWLGALLHYVTDTGSPPHTVGITGPAHTKMENWLDASKLDLKGYTPKVLTHDEFLARMDGLIEFSKARSERLRPLIAAGDRTASEPIIMESAAETARVAADAIYSLLKLSRESTPAAAGILDVEVTASQTTGMEDLPVKLAILGSTVSTLSDTITLRPGVYLGHIMLRGLLPGPSTVLLSRPGSRSRWVTFTMQAGAARQFRWTLEADPVAGNRLRNPDFQQRWVTSKAPDYWRFDARKKLWISDNVQVNAGKKYRVTTDPAGPVSVEWMAEHWLAAAPAASASGTAMAPEKATYVRILIPGAGDPAMRFKSVSVHEVE